MASKHAKLQYLKTKSESYRRQERRTRELLRRMTQHESHLQRMTRIFFRRYLSAFQSAEKLVGRDSSFSLRWRHVGHQLNTDLFRRITPMLREAIGPHWELEPVGGYINPKGWTVDQVQATI